MFYPIDESAFNILTETKHCMNAICCHMHLSRSLVQLTGLMQCSGSKSHFCDVCDTFVIVINILKMCFFRTKRAGKHQLPYCANTILCFNDMLTTVITTEWHLSCVFIADVLSHNSKHS